MSKRLSVTQMRNVLEDVARHLRAIGHVAMAEDVEEIIKQMTGLRHRRSTTGRSGTAA